MVQQLTAMTRSKLNSGSHLQNHRRRRQQHDQLSVWSHENSKPREWELLFRRQWVSNFCAEIWLIVTPTKTECSHHLEKMMFKLKLDRFRKIVQTSWRPFLTSPLGANFDPRGEVVPQESTLSPWGEIMCSSFHSSKQCVHPWGWTKGWTFPLGDKVHPLGLNSPLGTNFIPGDKPCC
jgi:hypothetical protein